MSFSKHLGFDHVSEDDGEAVVALDLSDDHMSRAERAHGGVLFSLLDSAMGRAVLSALPAGKGCATLEMKINFFRPVQKGRITATGRLQNLTRNTAYTEGEIVAADGKVLARASATFFITSTLKQSERERV